MSTLPAPASSAQARPPRRRGGLQDPEARRAQRLEHADDLDRLILWPKTNDGFLLRQLLYPFDQACRRIRGDVAGLRLTLDDGQALLLRASSALDELETLLPAGPSGVLGADPAWVLNSEGSSGDLPLSQGEKDALRAWRRSIAEQRGVSFFLPRSAEGLRLARLLPRFDAKMLQIRNSALQANSGQFLESATNALRRLHEVLLDLAASAGVDYRPPHGFKVPGPADGGENQEDAEGPEGPASTSGVGESSPAKAAGRRTRAVAGDSVAS